MPRRFRRLVRLARLGLTAAAIAQELQRPEGERTWQGLVAGFVPYDFRPPTFSRIRDAYWNPGDERLFLPRPWGVGWAVNLHRARLLMTRLFDSLMGARRPSLLVRDRERSA
jgi:hypothetical protein